MTFEKGNQALAAALSRRVDYELILTIEATDSLTGVRALAALTSFSTTNVCRGKFARGTSVDVEPEINTEESPSVTEHDAPASTQIVNVAGILRDLNMEDALTTEEKAEIARRAADELTDRVGSRLAAGLTKTQMDEFEAFTDRRELEAFAWLQANEPGFREDGRFVQVRRALPEDSSDLDVVCEYASLAWLERNRPGHRQEVAVLAREVEAEVRAYLLRVREERMDPKSPSEGPTE